MSRFFIHRPIAACVISIILMIAGGVAVPMLGVEQTPDITPPTVVVKASFPGASAQELQDSVAQILEETVNGVDDMLYLSSMCSDDGTYELTVTFEVGTDVDMATVLVQNRVSQAEPRLPEEVKRQGIVTEKKSTAIVLLVNLVSPDGRYDQLFLSNYIGKYINNELVAVPGVGGTTVMGAQDFSMRIWLNPEKLKSRGLTSNDVVRAIRDQNVLVAAGQIGAPPAAQGQQFQYSVRTRGRLETEAEFREIIVKTGEDGRIVRVGDVARVELGAESYNWSVNLNQQPSVAVAVYQLPGANSLDVANRVRAKMDELAADFPTGLQYTIPYDTTKFVTASINEVIETLFIAVLLVVLTVYVFLQDFRTTFIPAITIPVSLIATFAVMYFLGFTINTLSLFGLVLAIGVVVDDAIVVVENVIRLLETEDISPTEAALKTMREVSGPVVATTLVLLAVFVPTAVMGGISGRLYQQFALTIAVATVFSSLNALTLSPALAAMLLRKPPPAVPFNKMGPFARLGHFLSWPLRAFDTVLNFVTKGYLATVKGTIRAAAVSAVVFLGFVGLAGFGFISVPGGFLPDEDQGYVFVNVQLPPGATLERTAAVMDKVQNILDGTPGVANTVGVTGFSILDAVAQPNTGMYFVTLKPWDDRTEPQEQVPAILRHLQRQCGAMPEAVVLAFNPPPIQGLGNAGGFDYRLLDRGGSGHQQLQQVAEELVTLGNADPRLTRLNQNFNADVPQLYLEVDRVKAMRMGVPLEEVNMALQTYLGGLYVNDFNAFDKTFRVQAQADQQFRRSPENIEQLYVRDRDGQMIPLSTLVAVNETAGPKTIFRYQNYPAATVTGAPAPGSSSGQAVAAMEQLSAQNLPSSMTFAWSGVTYQQLVAGNQAPVIFALALAFVYLFLAFLYESWAIPLVVMFSVPLALLGAIGLTWLCGYDNNIYTQIGFILLMGLASKTAILVVEFAKASREEGLPIVDAAMKAAQLRFRAVLMTAFSFILGVIPLAVATGAGSGSRRALGTAVLGGMTAATVLGLLLIPVLYVIVQRFSEWLWPVATSSDSQSGPAREKVAGGQETPATAEPKPAAASAEPNQVAV